MDSMSFIRLLRIGLHGVALVLGSVGVFCFYWSCIGVPVAAAYAIVFLGTATAIILASDNERRVGR